VFGGESDDEIEDRTDVVAEAHLGSLDDLLDADVLFQFVEHRLRSGLDANHHTIQTGSHSLGEQRVSHTTCLIGAQRGGPLDPELSLQEGISERVSARRVREERLILKGQLAHAVPPLQFRSLGCDTVR
jgi:hypothetical protein